MIVMTKTRTEHSAFLLHLIFTTISLYHIRIPTVNSQLNVWPKPRNISWPTPWASDLSPSFHIASPNHAHLRQAVDRYLSLLLSERHQPVLPPTTSNISLSPPLNSLLVSVSNLSAPLRHGVDESYTLSIPSSGASALLSASTPWGAMRGLETLSQLVWYDGLHPRVVTGIEIWDAPLMPHRGLLLDTARNFYPVEDLERLIGALGMNKMNVFHWHLTDSQSFPVELPSEPELARKGAYSAEMTYSAADVRRVVEVGLSHGVRVLPEIDTPGHAGSWAEAYPDIVACSNMFWWPAGTDWADRLASEPGTGQLNPLNPKAYQVIKNVIGDIASLFPEPFYHAGADEVIPGCWKADPTVQKFLSNGGTLSQLLELFINITHPYLTSLNKTAVYWEDVLLDPTIHVGPTVLPQETTILQTWNNGPINTKRIVSAGYRVIVSSSEYYYLDCGHGGFVGNDSQYDEPSEGRGDNGGSWCAPFKTWQRIYDYDITNGLDYEETKLVLGGEVALWSEQADPTVLDSRVWPRASAMAEALWSGNRDESGKKRYAEATDRLNEWRYRMVGRGIGAEPIQPLWCVRHPGMCNTVQ